MSIETSEWLELSVEITISLLTMSRHSGIDSTPLSGGMLESLSVESSQESVHLSQSYSSVSSTGPVTVDETPIVPAFDGLGTDPKSTSSLRNRKHGPFIKHLSNKCPSFSRFHAAVFNTHGIGVSNLDYVMRIQPEQWVAAGVPIAQAESAMAARMKEVHLLTKARNHTQTTDAAKLLDIPFMCSHTPADSIGYQFLTKYLKDKDPQTLGNLVDGLLEIPEYQEAEKVGAGPEIIVGTSSGSVG